MLEILKITFPFFALVLCGYVVVRARFMPLEAITGLNTFVLYLALPCMLFRFGVSTPVARLFDPAVAAVWLPTVLLMVGGCVAFSLNDRIRWNDAAFGALVTTFSNTGFLGVPLLVALLGPRVAGPMIATVLIDLVVTSSLCIALSRLDGAGQGGAAAAARRALRGVAINPLPWAILGGGLASWLGLEPVRPLASTIGLLADSASPVALFSIGAVLARSRMLSLSAVQAPLPWRDYLPLALAKLFIHPLLVYGIGRTGIALGLPLDPFALVAITLVAALPSASNVAVVAERFGADAGRIVRIIMVTTVAAFLTLSTAVALLAPTVT